MIPVAFRPLRWEGPRTPADQRRSARAFRAGWQDTLDRLDYELVCLSATDIVVEIDIAEHELRRDGWPRSAARPVFPGVRLAFQSVHGPLIYATDSCEWWQHNLRSIALGLEALRAVDRYGITTRGEQYTGWAQLPAAPDSVSVRVAAETLVRIAGLPPDTAATVAENVGDARRLVVRKAMRAAHPDTGGSVDLWDELRRAASVLGVPL